MYEAYEGAALWRRADLEGKDHWVIRLDAGHIDELCHALAQVEARGLDVSSIERDDFPLIRVAALLEDVDDRLENGLGLVLLKGLPVERFDEKQLEKLYWGMGRYLGNPVSQNKFGDLLGHVRDQGLTLDQATVRGYQTKAELTMHTDSSDVVGLLCASKARSGGISRITSSMAAHNTVLAERPDLLEVLYRPFCLDRRGEQRPGVLPYYELAVFHRHDGYTTCRYNPGFIRSSQRHRDVPRLSEIQTEALAFLDEVSRRPELCMEMDLEVGDIQWVNNYVTLHGRGDYEDHGAAEKKRHMLRLWLSLPSARPLPSAFQAMYGSLEPGQRTGVPKQAA